MTAYQHEEREPDAQVREAIAAAEREAQQIIEAGKRRKRTRGVLHLPRKDAVGDLDERDD